MNITPEYLKKIRSMTPDKTKAEILSLPKDDQMQLLYELNNYDKSFCHKCSY